MIGTALTWEEIGSRHCAADPVAVAVKAEERPWIQPVALGGRCFPDTADCIAMLVCFALGYWRGRRRRTR